MSFPYERKMTACTSGYPAFGRKICMGTVRCLSARPLASLDHPLSQSKEVGTHPSTTMSCTAGPINFVYGPVETCYRGCCRSSARMGTNCGKQVTHRIRVSISYNILAVVSTAIHSDATHGQAGHPRSLACRARCLSSARHILPGAHIRIPLNSFPRRWRQIP